MKNYALMMLGFMLLPFYMVSYGLSKLFKIKGYEDMETITEYLDVATGVA